MYSILRRREIQDKMANTEPKHIFGGCGSREESTYTHKYK